MVVPSGLADSLNVPSLLGVMGGRALLPPNPETVAPHEDGGRRTGRQGPELSGDS
jgi:hypothetical protein